MNIPIPFIGGGGGSSDDCTATASDVLEGKTAVYNGSDDEPAEGSMKDYSGTTQSATASLDDSNNRVQMAVPNTGKYDTAARLYSSFSNMASLLGITADKIKRGENILGITGTWEGYITGDGDIYYKGAVGSIAGSLGTYSEGSYCSASAESDCILLVQQYGNGNTYNYCGASFSTAIRCANYSKITVTYNITATSGSNPVSIRFALGLYASRPTSGSAFDSDYTYREIWTGTSLGEHTITIDLSDISQTLYVGVYLFAWQTGTYATVEVTHIQVS